MIKFVLQIISDNTLNQKGTLEYGLSYDKTAMTLSKNRLIIDTRFEFNMNTGIVNIDSSQSYIFHEYLIRTYGTTTTINLNVKCIAYDQSYLYLYVFENNTIVSCGKSNRINMSGQISVHSIENGN